MRPAGPSWGAPHRRQSSVFQHAGHERCLPFLTDRGEATDQSSGGGSLATSRWLLAPRANESTRRLSEVSNPLKGEIFIVVLEAQTQKLLQMQTHQKRCHQGVNTAGHSLAWHSLRHIPKPPLSGRPSHPPGGHLLLPSHCTECSEDKCSAFKVS